MTKLKTLLITLGLLANFSVVLFPAAASAQINELKCGANSAATGSSANGGCPGAPKNQPSLNDIIASVTNIISSLVAVASVIMIIVGGFRYVTSGGDSNKVAAARGTIINALIGLVIAVMAQVIVRFVLFQVNKA
jgi:hypothetical protein